MSRQCGGVERAPNPSQLPRHAFGAWPKIRSRLRASDRRVIFLDFDGTLAEVQPRPGDVKMLLRVKHVLRRLVRRPNLSVVVVSGRRLRNVRRLVGVAGVHYFGLHGGEADGRPITVSGLTKSALQRARREVRKELGDLPGIWVENKGLSFSIHHRAASVRIVRAAHDVLCRLVEPLAAVLHILNGRRVWEVLPREIPGKFAAVQRVLGDLPAEITVVYIGDDDTDESAFGVLRTQITVRVGPRGKTLAHYYLRAPAEVAQFLARLEKELC